MIQAATPNDFNPVVLYVVLACLGVFFLVICVLGGRLFKLWTQAYFSGAAISMLDLIGMSLRKANPRVIIANYVRAVQGGLTLRTGQLESHLLAGGNVENVVSALIIARQRKLELDWERAAGMDLAGQDVLAYARNQPAGGPAAFAPAPLGPGLVGLSARAQEPILPPAWIEVDGRQVPALAEQDVVEAGEDFEIVGIGQHVLVRRRSPGPGKPFSE